MPNVFKYNPTSTEVQSLRVGDIYIGVGDVAKGPTTLTGFKNGPNLGTSSTAIIMNRDTGTFSWYINFTDQELISRTNRIDPTGINLITNNPTPTTNTTGYAVVGGVGTLTFDAGESAIRWLRTSYESWGAYVWNNSIQNYVFDKFSNYTATFEWKFGPSHSANESYNFEIINGPGTYIVLRVGLTASSTLQESGWYRFTRVSKPLQDGVGQTIQYRILRASTSGITDIYWRNLEYYKTTRTTKEECSSYFAGQSDKMLLNKDYESIVTDGLVLNFDAGFLPSYPGTGSSWYDLGPSQSNGTLQNGPTFDSGGWINFDGSNDYVSISSKSLVGSFTWMVVCFSNLMTGSQNRQTYFGGNTALFEQSDNDTLLISNFSDPAINLELPTSIIPQSIFYHICITRKSDNTFDFYHNGLKRTLRSGGSIPGDFVINQIGSLNGARFWNGRISNASVYNRVLSQSEILQNYYKGPIITDELVYAYDPGNLICFDGLSTVARSLSQSFTASVSNGTLFINENGGVWDLDGTDEFINLGTQITSYNFNPSTTNFSMGGWISIRQHKNYSTVIDITGSGAARNGLFVTNTGSLIYQVRPNAGTISTIASYTQNSIALNRWYHLFLTVDISSLTAKLYVNGSNVTTTTGWIANQIPTTLLEQYLGYYRDSGQSTNGRIGPVFLYVNKSLTDFEVLQNFNTQRSRFAI